MLKTMFHILLFLGVLLLIVLLGVHFFQHRLIFFPTVLPQDHVFHFGGDVEEVFLTADDGAVIHALYFKAGDPRGAVLYFHGNAGDLSGWGQLASQFLEHGHSVLMPDYRGFGKSRGQLSEAALHADARLMLEHLLKDHPLEEIVVYGRSIGTGIAVPLAEGLPVKALVLETPFTRLAHVARVHYPWLPADRLLHYRFLSDEAIGRVRAPVWIIHGTADEVIPFELGKRLAEMAEQPVEFIPVQGGGHNDLEDHPEHGRMMEQVLR
jgi:pimeloyl-ACP methyl ester carboxylesterase